MIINDIFDVQFKINGIEILESQLSVGFTATISENIYSGFPVCRVGFSTSGGFLDKCPIVDGTLMEFFITNKIYNTKESLKFRVSQVSTQILGKVFTFVIDGYLDFYEYFRNANRYAAYGLSSEIFKNVAEANNLNYSIDPTNDKQVWIPSETNVGTWLSTIANHGWYDEVSCMLWFMDRFKKLHYRNLSDLFYSSKNIAHFDYGKSAAKDIKENVFRYKTFSFNADTGLDNIKNGYSGRNHHFDLLSYQQISQNANKTRSITEIVNINKELSQNLAESFLEFDVGNFHEHYYLAAKQNKRLLSLLSTYIVLGCEQYMPIRLGDIVTFNPVSTGTDTLEIKSLKCKYIVSSLKTHITNKVLNMEVTLCTQGYNGASKESY